MLKPKKEMSENEMLFCCICIEANKYRFSYGRQINKTLKEILIPSLEEIQKRISKVKIKNIKAPSNYPNKKNLHFFKRT